MKINVVATLAWKDKSIGIYMVYVVCRCWESKMSCLGVEEYNANENRPPANCDIITQAWMCADLHCSKMYECQWDKKAVCIHMGRM